MEMPIFIHTSPFASKLPIWASSENTNTEDVFFYPSTGDKEKEPEIKHL